MRICYRVIGILLAGFCFLLTGCGANGSREEPLEQTTSGAVETTSADNVTDAVVETKTFPRKPSEAVDTFAAAYAADILSVLMSQPSQYGITAQELEGAYFSTGFTVQNAQSEIYYYALVGRERVLGVLSVFPSGDRYTASYDVGFSAALTEARQSGKPFALRWEAGIPFNTLAVSYDDIAEETDVSGALNTPSDDMPQIGYNT